VSVPAVRYLLVFILAPIFFPILQRNSRNVTLPIRAPKNLMRCVDPISFIFTGAPARQSPVPPAEPFFSVLQPPGSVPSSSALVPGVRAIGQEVSRSGNHVPIRAILTPPIPELTQSPLFRFFLRPIGGKGIKVSGLFCETSSISSSPPLWSQRCLRLPRLIPTVMNATSPTNVPTPLPENRNSGRSSLKLRDHNPAYSQWAS